MARDRSCPENAALEDLLNGTLPSEEEPRLGLHLAQCVPCQARYEELAGQMVSIPEPEEAATEQDTWVGQMVARITADYPPLADGRPLVEGRLDLPGLRPSDNPDQLGRIGPYDVLEVLGRGGMGVVLKGRDPRLHRWVAIKVLAPQLAASRTARSRFLREAQAVAAVNHDHVVTIHAVDEIDGYAYLVMEYVGGGSLAERIRATGPLSLAETLRLGSQIAAGLAAAHARGLVHRDIKPGNILLEGPGERVKITDFGLARAIDDVQITHGSVVCGTPEYMSPEQARGQEVDARGDLFSLGCVLYAMATGQSPFPANNLVDALLRVCREPHRPLRQLRPDYPEWLEAVIDKLLAKAPDDRYQSAAEVAELLTDQGRRDSFHQERPWSDTPRRARSPSCRRWRVAPLAVVALGVLGWAEATGRTQLFATAIRLVYPEGIIELTLDEPNARVTVDGKEVAIHGAGPQEIRLHVGEHLLQVQGARSEHKEILSVTRDGKTVVKVVASPSPPAVPGSAQGLGTKLPAPAHPVADLEERVDLIAFHWQNLQLELHNGAWILVDGQLWLLKYPVAPGDKTGAARRDAEKAQRILQHYHLNQQFFFGSPRRLISYFLSEGRPPQGAFAGEEAVRIDWQQTRAEFDRTAGHWKVTDGDKLNLDFRQPAYPPPKDDATVQLATEEREAKRCAAIIRKYQFQYKCSMGPIPELMTYFRGDLPAAPR